jgi:hypothetical protein
MGLKIINKLMVKYLKFSCQWFQENWSRPNFTPHRFLLKYNSYDKFIDTQFVNIIIFKNGYGIKFILTQLIKIMFLKNEI